jgi:hypothetical protein
VLVGYLFLRYLIGTFVTSEPVIELAKTLLHLMLCSCVLSRHVGLNGVWMAYPITFMSPPAGDDPWPGADDWRGQCSRLYA